MDVRKPTEILRNFRKNSEQLWEIFLPRKMSGYIYMFVCYWLLSLWIFKWFPSKSMHSSKVWIFATIFTNTKLEPKSSYKSNISFKTNYVRKLCICCVWSLVMYYIFHINSIENPIFNIWCFLYLSFYYWGYVSYINYILWFKVKFMKIYC